MSIFLSYFLISLTWALYGVMTPISASRMPISISSLIIWITRSTSPKLYFDSVRPTSYSTASYIKAPAVSINIRGSPLTVSPTSSSLLSSLSKSPRMWSLTELWATSLPSYIVALDHCIMAEFIRYCSTSIVWKRSACGNLMTRSNRERDRP